MLNPERYKGSLILKLRSEHPYSKPEVPFERVLILRKTNQECLRNGNDSLWFQRKARLAKINYTRVETKFFTAIVEKLLICFLTE